MALGTKVAGLEEVEVDIVGVEVVGMARTGAAAWEHKMTHCCKYA